MFQHHRFLITLCTLLLAQVPMVTISPPGFPTLTCALTVDGGPHSRLKVLTAFCAFFYQINFYYYFLFHSLAGLLFGHTSMSCLQDPTLFECNFRLYFFWQKVAVRGSGFTEHLVSLTALCTFPSHSHSYQFPTNIGFGISSYPHFDTTGVIE